MGATIGDAVWRPKRRRRRATTPWEFDLPGLVSLIRCGNVASRRVAEKIGMEWQEDIERYGLEDWHFALSRQAAAR